MLTVEFGILLRGMLSDGGFSADLLRNIGSHSLKVTTLSWLAKAGLPREIRRTLGYHIRPGDRVMDAYSRDVLAGPLRELTRVLNEISGKRFDPDSTRSGYFAVGSASRTSSTSSASSSASTRVTLAEPSVVGAMPQQPSQALVAQAGPLVCMGPAAAEHREDRQPELASRRP